MSSQEEDATYGDPFVHACWALTAVVSVALIFRYTVKAWASWILPSVSSPTRIWGPEDILYVIGYGFDIAHMIFIQKSLDSGLGRHVWFLKDEDRIAAMKWDFISQPLAVTASMFSRCGMTWFLYTCFNGAGKSIRIAFIVGAVIQVVANSVTVLQIVLQCGPDPYRVTNRAAYFHYMWDGVPTDGSAVCQSPDVQTTIGFVQGAFNSAVDFSLTILSAMQLWQFSMRAMDGAPTGGNSFFVRFKRMPKHARNRRIWQTLILSVPLALSGCASIVKTYLLKSLGERNDFTHNIVPFILWVKYVHSHPLTNQPTIYAKYILTIPRIENYSILLATCGPILRLFVRVVFDNHGKENSRNTNASRWGYWSSSAGAANQYGRGLDLDGHIHTQNQGSVVMSVFADKGAGSRVRGGVDADGDSDLSGGDSIEVGAGGVRDGGDGVGDGIKGVTVKTDITVQVDEEGDGGSTSGLVRPRYT
ncbi:hypothetical protein BJX99DRAFT_32926 [Aspergillus californicus]